MSTFSNDIINNTLGITLEKETFTSGEQVNGIIYTNLLKDFNLSGYQLVLKIKGKETVDFWRKTRKPLPKKPTFKFTASDGSEPIEETHFRQTNCFLNHMYQ